MLDPVKQSSTFLMVSADVPATKHPNQKTGFSMMKVDVGEIDVSQYFHKLVNRHQTVIPALSQCLTTDAHTIKNMHNNNVYVHALLSALINAAEHHSVSNYPQVEEVEALKREHPNIRESGLIAGYDLALLSTLLKVNIVILHSRNPGTKPVSSPPGRSVAHEPIDAYEAHMFDDSSQPVRALYILYRSHDSSFQALIPVNAGLRSKNFFEILTQSRYVNHGTYGCVFRPAIPCPRDQNGRIGYVSKIFMENEDAEEEIAQYNNTIGKIDPQGIFTLKMRASCAMKTNTISKTEFDKCKFHEKPAKMMQVILQDGGDDLFKAATHTKFEHIFAALGSVFEGLTILEANAVVHMDIKPVNMVYNTRSGKLALIDFGLVRSFSEVMVVRNEDKDLNFWLTAEYAFYPIEFTLIANQNRVARYGEQELPQNRNFAALMKQVKLRLDSVRGKLGESDEISEIVTKIEQQATAKVVFKVKQLVPEKIDVYSLGVSILLTFAACFKHGNVATFVDFHRNVLNLCQAMIISNPAKRLDAGEAFASYKHIMKCAPICLFRRR